MVKVSKPKTVKSRKESPISVVTAVDENYIIPLAAMIRSMIENLKSRSKITLYVLHKRIGEQSKIRIRNSIDPRKINVIWTRVDDKMLQNLKTTEKRITLTTYYRLLVPYILPAHLEKAIYLDCDTIISEDIGMLWDSELGDKYLLAVPEMSKYSLYVSSPRGLSLFNKLGINPQCKCFNGGVLVINLKKWREDNVTSRIIDFLKTNKENILWWDQDGLNAILAGKWGELDPRWNLITQFFYHYSSWKESPFDEKIYNGLIKRPYIIHFNTKAKPWHPDSRHPRKDLFFHYLDMTAWKGWRP